MSKAPTPSGVEVGAVSAIADHSTGGISGPSAIDPAVEAVGAVEPLWVKDARRRYIAVLIGLLERCAKSDEAELMDRIERLLEVAP